LAAIQTDFFYNLEISPQYNGPVGFGIPNSQWLLDNRRVLHCRVVSRAEKLDWERWPRILIGVLHLWESARQMLSAVLENTEFVEIGTGDGDFGVSFSHGMVRD
jgi:hypothetical protein